MAEAEKAAPEKRKALGQGTGIVVAGRAAGGCAGARVRPGLWRLPLAGGAPAPHVRPAPSDAVVQISIELIDENPYQTRVSLRRSGLGGAGEFYSGERRGPAGGGASRRGRTLHADFGRAALPGIEAGGEDDDSGDGAPRFRPAGGGDDRRRKPAAAGLELHRAGVGVFQAEPRFWIDPGADRAAGGSVAGVGFELHAPAEAAGRSAAAFAGRAARVQRGSGAVAVAGSQPD